MPAYNAEKTLELTYKSLPEDSYDEIIVGDDCSSDKTVEVAEKLNLDVIKTPQNMGYGANQKMLYKEAFKRDTIDIFVRFDEEKIVVVYKNTEKDVTDDAIQPLKQ